MPHLNLKHFPSLSKEQQEKLSNAFTQVITDIIKCDEGVVSIAFQPVVPELWYEHVYLPEIINRKELLCKFPKY